MKLIKLYTFLFIILFAGCKSKPKVIVEDTTVKSDNNNSSVDAQTMNNPATGEAAGAEVHQVIAGETLNTERYTYINVTENQEKFWIAVPRQDIIKGHSYYYRGGLKKTNFESQEFKRTFDVIYLVPSIIDAQEHPGGNISQTEQKTSESMGASKVMTPVKDIVKISDLMKNKSKYSGKTIVVNGKCIKANYQIMGRNWFHIQDGSSDDGKKIDLTVTSTDNIQIGDQVNFKGVISVNKDFGAGYKYELIMESATLLER